MPGKRILIGVITGAHGIKGEIKLRSFAAEPDAIARYGPLESAAGPIEIVQMRAQKDGFIAVLKGVSDRNLAEALRGIELYVPRDRLPEPAADETYASDLIGLTAVRPDGSVLGEVVGVENYGAGDLLDIKVEGRVETILVPFADAFVPEIDLTSGRAVIALPEGYMEEEP